MVLLSGVYSLDSHWPYQSVNKGTLSELAPPRANPPSKNHFLINPLLILHCL